MWLLEMHKGPKFKPLLGLGLRHTVPFGHGWFPGGFGFARVPGSWRWAFAPWRIFEDRPKTIIDLVSYGQLLSDV
jgi:hypothetical protein